MSDAKLATIAPIAPAAAPALPPKIAIADTYANPAPLGLLCFAMTTVLLSAHNAGLIALDAAIVAMAVFYGGAAQIIAGIFEWRKNNTFASTAFISYGSFWLTIAGIIVFPKLGLADKPSGTTMAAYLGLWGLISFILFIGTLRLNRALQVVFFLLTVAFALLALCDLTGTGDRLLQRHQVCGRGFVGGTRQGMCAAWHQGDRGRAGPFPHRLGRPVAENAENTNPRLC